MVLDWLRKNSGTLSKVLTAVGDTASFLGNRGVPFAGLVGDVCGLGNKLLGLADGGDGGSGGGCGGVASATAMASMDLSSIKSGIANVENDTNEIKKRLEDQGQDIKDIKTILEDGLTTISKNMESMGSQLDTIQNTAMKSFEMIKEMNYVDGIENVKSAHKVFFAKTKLDLEKRIQQFENHQFELSKQYNHHMNPQKIGRFLRLLTQNEDGNSNEDGKASALAMYHYVMTVEAMYLQMMSVVHIYNEDSYGLIDQLENFTAHSKDLTRIMSSILKLDDHKEELTYDDCVYKELTGFVADQVSDKVKIEDMAIFMSKDSVNHSIFSRTDKAGHVLYHIPLLWIASEAGSLKKIENLLMLGADINMTAFDSHGVPMSCLQIAANKGHLHVVNVLIEQGAQLNNGRNCLLDPCKQGKEDIVKALLGAGEDPNRPGKEGKTPLFFARKEGHGSISALLEQHGADTHMADILKKGTKAPTKKTKEISKKTEDDDGGRKTIRARSMTSELRSIINKVKSIANVDDSWLNACQAVFQTGGEVICDYNPDGNSRSNPMLCLTMPGNTKWTYPF